MLAYYVLILMVCYKAALNDQEASMLEEGYSDEPVSINMIGELAATHGDFMALKAKWFNDVLERQQQGSNLPIYEALAQWEVIEPTNRERFKLWFFFSQRILEGIDSMLFFNTFFWILLLFTFAGFFFLHYFCFVAYIKISFAVNLLALAILIYMFANKSRSNARVYPRTIIAIFQFPLFLQCFIAIRLIVCKWMWIYYFWIALCTFVILVIYFVFYYLVVAPLVVLFYIRSSFCPNIDDAAGQVDTTMVTYELCAEQEVIATRSQALIRQFRIARGSIVEQP